MQNEERDAILRALVSRLTPAVLASHVPDNLHVELPRIQQRNGLMAPPLRSAEDLAGILVDLHGSELLRSRTMRLSVLESCSAEVLGELMEATGIHARGRTAILHALASRKWTPGKHWARTFVHALRLPPVLVGVARSGRRQPIDVVEAYVPLPDLHDFQDALRGEVLDMLGAPPGRNRGILSLPTGAGKTRTAVEAVIEYLRTSPLSGSVLWIAQSDELCEQAVMSFREVWVERMIRESRLPPDQVPAPRPLSIYRFWGDNSCSEVEASSVVVAGIQKLKRLERTVLREFIDEMNVVIIDEAHHAIASSYTPVFEAMFSPEARPILGLTATPFRGNEQECRRLIRRFNKNLMVPNFSDPIAHLRERGVLSHIKSEVTSTSRSFTLSSRELDQVATFHDLPAETLDKIGKDTERNRAILKRLLQIPPGTPVLFFGCSVAHARIMSLLLRREKRTAVAITYDTPVSLRRNWIELFKTGQIQFLCNVEALTTGFDAPKVEVVAIARPTASVLLYEQMVGRGMRGPQNGGTMHCLLIDFVDNIASFNEPMSYARISDLWRRSSAFK